MKCKIYTGGREISDPRMLQGFQTEEVGLFETMRLYHGKIFRGEEHISRLFESAKTVGYPKHFSLSRVKQELGCAVKAFGEKEAILRLTVVGGQVVILIGKREHPIELYKKGVALRTSPVLRSFSNAAFPEAKTSAYQNPLMASLEPRSRKIYEWILLDRSGFVTEARIGNLFIVGKINGNRQKKQHLFTPPLAGILNGVTRKVVIECARTAGHETIEEYFTRHDVFNAQEAFLTNTSWEILPVIELDGRRIGDGIPGVVTKKIHQIFQKKVRRECRGESSFKER